MSVMLAIAIVCAALAGLVHVYIFILESVVWTSARARRTFNIANEEEANATRFLAYNQGFYNLFLAIGSFLGVVLVFAGNGATGWPIAIFACACMLAASIILGGSNRRYLSSAFAQGTLPFIALLFAFLGAMLPD